MIKSNPDKNQPTFLYEDDLVPVRGEFRPLPLPRRGEATAYGLAGALLITLGIRWYISQEVPALLALAAFGGVLLALLISYGNWMERNTRLYMDQSGLSFERPTRTVQCSWDQISDLYCERERGGWRFDVVCRGGHFRFQDEVVMRSSFGGEVRTGFPDGQKIAASIRQSAALRPPAWIENRWWCSREPRGGLVES
jgi:hypothetical protein